MDTKEHESDTNQFGAQLRSMREQRLFGIWLGVLLSIGLLLLVRLFAS